MFNAEEVSFDSNEDGINWSPSDTKIKGFSGEAVAFHLKLVKVFRNVDAKLATKYVTQRNVPALKVLMYALKVLLLFVMHILF